MNKLISVLIFNLLLFSQIFSQESENVTVLGRWPDGPCETLALKDNIAVIGNGSSVKILDITYPDSVIQLSQLDCSGFVWDVYLFADTIFIGTDYGILSVNISVPTIPKIISKYETVESVYTVFYQNSKLFFAEDNILKMINYPITVFSRAYKIFETDRLTDFYIQDTLAYVNDAEGGLFIIDFSNLIEPEVLSIYKVPGHYHIGVYVLDDVAYITTAALYANSKVQLLDVSDPYLPTEYGYLNCRGDMSSTALRVSIKDTMLFATYRSDIGSGFIIGSINNFYQPYIINDVSTDLPNEVIFQENKLFISADYLGLQIYDVNNPFSVTLLNEFKTRGNTFDIFIKNNLAFVANDRGSLRIIDFRELNNIYELGFFEFDTTIYATVRSVFVRANLAYVTSRGFHGGLKIVDVTEPNNPYELSYASSTYGISITLEGDFAFIADGVLGMNIFNVSDSTNPQKVWQLSGEENGVDIFVKDTLCVLAASYAGTSNYDINIYGVNDPSSPFLLSTIPPLSAATGVFIDGDLLYIADGEAGLRVFDIANPYNPVLISTYNQNSSVRKVIVKEEYAYITDRKNGLEILDVQDINDIKLKGYYRSNSVKNIFVKDNLIFLAEGNSGMSILRNDLITDVDLSSILSPKDLHLSQNYPNPFNPSTKIKFTIPFVETGHAPSVQLKVYDILGNEIATLVNEELPAGEYEVEFNSRGLIHQTLSSGIYFYQLRAGDFVQTKKMLLLK